jgi:hypothetical protein
VENSADQSSIDRKKNKQADYDTARKIVVRTLMSNQQGRMYIWQELSSMNVFSQTLQFGRDGHIATAFAEGRRSIGLRLLGDVTRHCPDEYMLMTKENAAQPQLEQANEHPEE